MGGAPMMPMGGAPMGMGGAPMGGAPMGPPGMMGGGMMGGGGADVNTTLPLVLGILSTLCCGMFIGFGLGIAAIVLSVQAGNAKKAGDIVTAQAKAKTATILAAIGLGIGILGNIIGAILRS